MGEASRIKSVEPEVIGWSIATEEKRLNNGQQVTVGMVVCTNQYGSQWGMTVTDFDNTYKAR